MTKIAPSSRKHVVGRELRLRERHAEGVVEAHHLARRAHLGAEDRIELGKLLNGNTASFTDDVGREDLLGESMSASVSPGITRAASARERHAGRLRHERHRAARARIHLEHVDHAVLDRVLHVDQPDDAERLRERACAPRISSTCASPMQVGRQHARGIAGVHAGVLDVLHDPADDHAVAVGERVHVGLERVLEEAVDEHGVVSATRARRARSSPCSDCSS